tara:strand:+ start:1148 stop:1546 length:399 start_codon:yes stop_codon:yes gene_type:complete
MKRIWTNGCFDILHVGHMRLLKYARSLGDTLIVGIDSDRRVQQLKGDNRPINSHDIRKEMLLSIRWVDNVIIFDCEKELENLIKKHSDTMVVGSDYKSKIVVGSKHSDVVFFDRVEEHSTTNILKELPYGHN